MKRSSLLGAALALFAATLPLEARAQASGATPSSSAAAPTSPPTSSDVTTAAELFRQGRAAFDANDVPTARARLLESARLNPRVGTFISLAQCEETLGALASARAHWQQAVALGGAQGDARAAFAQEHLTAIDTRVPRLTLRPPSAAPAGTVVRLDDIELGAASLGLALPAEVGKHVVVVLAPGYGPSREEIDLAEHQERDVMLDLGPASPAPPPKPSGSESPPDSGGRVRGPLRVASYAAMGLGLVAAGVGTYFGVKAIEGKSAAGCAGDVCTGPGAATRNDAIGDGNVSTGVFVASGALVATGVALWFFSRPVPEKAAIVWSPTIAPDRLGLAARVTW